MSPDDFIEVTYLVCLYSLLNPADNISKRYVQVTTGVQFKLTTLQ
jgi:hypothetical protein